MTSSDATLVGSRTLPRVRAGGVLARLAAVLTLIADLVRLRVGAAVGVITPAGLITLLLGATMTALGIAAGWVEFMVLGAVFLATLGGCALFLLGRTTYEIRLDLDPPRIAVGDTDPARVTVRVGNHGRRALLPARLEVVHGASGRETFTLPRLRPREAHAPFEFPIFAERRGVVPVGPVLSVRGDPLGLLRRTLRWPESRELFIHPAIRRVSPTIIGRAHDLEGRESAVVTADDLTFHALRDYVPGDDQRHIHWRSSARHLATGRDAYQVRQFQETRRSQVTLLLPEDGAGFASEEEFELAVSVFASVGVQAIASGAAAAPLTDTRVLRDSSVTAFLDDTSRLTRDPRSSVPFRALVRRALRRAPVPDVLVLVVGSRVADGSLREAVAVAREASAVVVMRARLGAAAEVSRVGDLLSLSVGDLDDLPRALRMAGLA
ncbi:DUF58 domain-containing protein [Pseudolysinimonas sp.]|jgi:uncharacterized protein (DUF58 family)|uniref:DUF58 domain-containing protein n=1 Tax=Pseudolysinimonas sp. TaxID=2680009 RepID=UPI0037832572